VKTIYDRQEDAKGASAAVQLQHMRDVDCYAMPEEKCNMMTGTVITAEVEIPAASVFCTFKHPKRSAER
jgi:hypothetical protein